jgi:hypothetical protein
MLKNLKSTLLVNGIGLGLLMLSFCGDQGWIRAVQSKLRRAIVIDAEDLKKKLSHYSEEELKKMLAAGKEIEKWNEILRKTGLNVVKQVLEGQEVLSTLEHYPSDDTFDEETYSQYYYHSHRYGEHGHFHLFLRQGGMDEGTVPLFYNEKGHNLDPTGTFAHLVAISMDDEGYPLTLFTVNRWVTGETWYRGEDLKKMVDRFAVNHAYPSYIVNQWLKAMLVLFRPQIDALIDGRDQKITSLKEALENQEMEVISEETISIETQMQVIQDLLKERSKK